MKIFSQGAVLLGLLIIFPFFATKPAAAKVLPQARGISPATAVKSGPVTGISVSPRLRGDRLALIVNYGNLQNAINVSYILTYKTSTQDEGAMGTLPLGSSSTATSELLFGTCSKNVCRYHTGIRDAKLEITYTTKAGKKYLKRYKIRV